jgi:phage terminase large subunit-like protein
MPSPLSAPRVGSQRPRILVAPESVSSSGAEAVELARQAGLILDPWQQYALEVGLGERADGQWSAFETAVIVSRQQGKGAIFEALALAKLVLFESQLFIYSSHEFKTSREAFRRIGALIDMTPELSSRVLRTVKNPSEFGYDFRQGQRLRFFARSGGSGRGWSADDLFFDEAFKLGSEGIGALIPTLATRPNPQIWYASSAAWATSDQLQALRKRALSDDDAGRLAYLEWSAPEDADIHDRDAWAQACPALGYRLTEEFIEAELRAMESEPDMFRRERLSIPDSPDVASGGIDPVVWQASADPESAAIDPVTFALEVGDDREWSCISVGGKRADGLWHGAVVDYRRGTEWVVDRAAELWRKWSPSAFVIDPSSPAGSLIPLLEARGVVVTKVTTREVSQACGQFYDFVRQGDFRHRDDPALNVAVRSATRRTTGDLWRFERRSATDISPLLSVVIALWVASRERVPLADADLLQTFH